MGAKSDFSGYATKAGLKCSDGRTIMPGAFKHLDGQRVPLVWNHQHNEPSNVLGHALLEHREDGIYAYGFFNKTEAGQYASGAVEHGDIVAMSIYANQLQETDKNVKHGVIREVSLVIAGANPGAMIDNVTIQHGDEVQVLDQAVIFTGEELEHGEEVPDEVVEARVTQDKQVADELTHADKTVKQVWDSFSEEQKTVALYLIGEAAGGSLQQNDTTNSLTHQETEEMTKRLFENNGGSSTGGNTDVLQHGLDQDQLMDLVKDAKKKGSFHEAALEHAETYGITNIELLFPEARDVTNTPEWITRRTEWVSKVKDGARKTPFSRIKSMSADLTHEEARAKGYIKGNLKKEQFFSLAKRTTGPTTIYKKQRLDRDDIIDITGMDVVAWIWGEMRLMLDEEIARAVLIGDGREFDDEDKIDETCIRPIAKDDDFYSHKVVVPANVRADSLVEYFLRERRHYKGSNPSFFTTTSVLMDMLLAKDTSGRRLYQTKADLIAALNVREIVEVDVMENLSLEGGEVLAVIVNMADYTIGSDRGGQITTFDDFDIDYNQYKYLIEGRMSGTLTRHKTAMVLLRGEGVQVAVVPPAFNQTNGVATLTQKTGVVWKDQTGTVRTGTAQQAIEPGSQVTYKASAADGYYFPGNTQVEYTFTRPVN